MILSKALTAAEEVAPVESNRSSPSSEVRVEESVLCFLSIVVQARDLVGLGSMTGGELFDYYSYC